MRGDPDLPAVLEYRAGRTLRKPAGADMLAEWHEEAVDLHPIRLRQDFLEGEHRLFRRSRVDDTPPIRHAVHVNVHADPRLAARHADGQVGALRADALE